MPSKRIIATAGLPTPIPSSEICAKETVPNSPMDSVFTLPPAAMWSSPSTRNSSVSSVSQSGGSEPSCIPLSPHTAAIKAAKQLSPTRRKINSAIGQHSDYTLPPPPTRNRKIIQMKPRAESPQQDTTANSTGRASKLQAVLAPALLSSKTAVVHATTATTSSSGTGTKRKQTAANSNTAAGRKMARKTAHSLIERRRRSKMNEEFGVLQNLIPACHGQEMHKLAILQASIEYTQYLEKCLADLNTVHSKCQPKPSVSPAPMTATTSLIIPSTRSSSVTPQSEDTDMLDLPPIRHVLGDCLPSISSEVSQPQRLPSISPSIPALTHSQSIHSAQTSPLQRGVQSTYHLPSISDSGLPSPAFEGQNMNKFTATLSLMSPVVSPHQDQEATTALLMLNNDRRSWSQRGSIGNGEVFVQTVNRSMSVKDLLTL